MMVRFSSALRLLVLIVLLSGASWVRAAAGPEVRQPQVDTPKRILFVGNSYFYY